MELRQLEYFVGVTEAGSYSRAAAALNMAQPSVSRQVALLEAELGQRLFVRTGRGVTPTEAGAVLLVHARSMLDAAARARAELRDLSESPSGRVVVGMPPRVAHGLSVPLIQRFRTRFPKAVITVIEALSLSLRESLIGGRMDMALMFDPQPSPQLHYERLLREALVLVAPPGTKLPARVRLAALADYPMVLPSAPNAIRALLDEFLKPRGIVLQVLAEAGTVSTAVALAVRGAGCTVLPESALRASATADALPRATIGPPAIRNALVLAIPRARPSTRLLRETAQMLRELDFRQPAAAPAARAASPASR
jgi:LysR family nitrogen assimilation transcriptional regulator